MHHEPAWGKPGSAWPGLVLAAVLLMAGPGGTAAAPRVPLPSDLVKPIIPPAKPPKPLEPLQNGPKLSPEEAALNRQKCERASYIVQQANEFGDESPLTESYYKRALSLCPGHAEANFRLGVIAYHQKNIEDATKFFERAIRSQPRFVEARYNIGIIQRLLKKPAEARKTFERIIEIDPTHALSLYNLGVLQVRALERPKALETFRRAVRANPKLAEAHFFIGALLQEQGKRTKAKAQLERALALNPKLALPRIYLAAIVESEGRSREAQDILNRALELNPASVNVGYGYEEFYFREGGGNAILTRIASRDATTPPPKRASERTSRLAPAPRPLTPPAAPITGLGRPARELPVSAVADSEPPTGGKLARELPVGSSVPPKPPKKEIRRRAKAPSAKTLRREPAAEAPRPAGVREYRVRRGDTLLRIAKREGVSLTMLIHLNRNRIEHPSVLEAGQTIYLPRRTRAGSKTSGRRVTGRKQDLYRNYRIKPGETLAGIARRFGTTIKHLMRLNRDRIEYPTIIAAGDVIRVPRSRPAPTGKNPEKR